MNKAICVESWNPKDEMEKKMLTPNNFVSLTWDLGVPHSPSSDKIARRKRIVLLRKKSWGEDGRRKKKPKRSGFLFLGRSSFSCYVTCCIEGAPSVQIGLALLIPLSACWCFEALLRVWKNKYYYLHCCWYMAHITQNLLNTHTHICRLL